MKKTTKIIVALIVIVGISLGIVLGINKAKESSEKISIIATNFPAYDFARAVAGDKANIKMLVKPGAETHDFEPTPQDIIDIKNSALFVYTGGESDEWIEDILEDTDIDKTKLVKMMGAVEVVEEETVEGMEHEHHHEHEEHDDHEDEEHDDHHEHEEEVEYDEHVWTSPKNAIRIVGAIKDELSKISPKYETLFTGNSKAYINKLSELDQKFQDIVKAGNRKTVIFGDRFPLRYFVDEYGLNYYAAFPGCSDQTEANSKTIAFLVDKIKNEKIPVVFKIEMGNGKLAETISNETGAKVLEFQSAHNISSDEFNNGVTYVDLMERNLSALKEALN